jgi:hypothetical protein
MLELLLVGLFVSFLLALFDNLIVTLGVVVSPVLVNTIFSASSSLLGAWLLGYGFHKKLIVFVVASAFLGRVILKSAERLITFRSVIVNNTRDM